MNIEKSLYAYLVIGVIVIGLMAFTMPQAKATPQFVISGSTFPDEYGQGIEELYLYENSTGAWVAILDGDEKLIFPDDEYETTIIFNYSANTAIEFIIGVSINHTLFGLSTKQEALNIIRVNLVMTVEGEELFSKNNVTHGGGLLFNKTATTWLTFYDVVVNVLITKGTIYIITMTYEVYYE